MIALKAGITIAMILDDFGIRYRRNRCACPIHGGDNPTAFSFNDHTYYCHTRGCKGDVITLLQILLNTDFLSATEYLAKKKGIYLSLSPFRRKIFNSTVRKPKQKDQCEKKIRIRLQLAWQTIQEIYWTARLRMLRRQLKAKQISEVDYYTALHICDYRLDCIDEEKTRLNHEFKCQ